MSNLMRISVPISKGKSLAIYKNTIRWNSGVHLGHCLKDGGVTCWLPQTGAHSYILIIVYENTAICGSRNYTLMNAYL